MSTITTNGIGAAGSAGMIHPAIIAIMRAVGPIAKSQKNSSQSYQYRGIDQVYNEVHPHFAEHGVYSTSEILDAKHLDGKSEKGKAYVHSILKMRFTFWAADGSKVITEVVGEGIDFGGDKASNKAMSVADKYAILQLLKIPTATVDSDATVDDAKGNGNGTTAATPTAPKKSAMELMQEAAAAEAGEPTNGDGKITADQLQRLDDLTVALQCGEKISSALQKRGLGSRRELIASDATSIIAKLEAELAAKKEIAGPTDPPAVGDKTPTRASQEHIQRIRDQLKEWAQIDNASYSAAVAGLKKKLADAGFANGLSDLSSDDAARLYIDVVNRKLDAFFQRSLEDWRPKQKEAPPTAATQAAAA